MERETSSSLRHDKKVASTVDLGIKDWLSRIPKDVNNNKMIRSALR